MNSFAVIFGHLRMDPAIAKGGAQPVFRHWHRGPARYCRSQGDRRRPTCRQRQDAIEARKKSTPSNACFATCEVPPENTNHSKHAEVSQLLYQPPVIWN